MHFSPSLLLPLLALAYAIPTSLTARQEGVDTTYLAVVPGGNCNNGQNSVAENSTITSPFCTEAGVSEYLVGQLPDVDCTATIYSGFGCVAGTETSVTDVPAGSGNVCVFSGSFQGICSHCPQISFGYTCSA